MRSPGFCRLISVFVCGIGRLFSFFGSNIGPALVALFSGNSASIADLWVFIVGPLADAALAAVCYKYLESPDAAKK